MEWFGELPEQWESKRTAAILTQRKEKNDPIQTNFILSLSARYGVVPYSERKEKGGNKPKSDLTKYAVARENDLLVNCMNVLAGSSGVTKWDGAISPVYYALFPRNEEINIWYYNYIFRLITFYRSLIGYGKGILIHESENGNLNTIRLRIAMSSLNNVILPLPPREEQDQIVQYLDWKVSQINKLINTKKKQIALLQEQKQSVINQAVTKGLNPDTEMKDSGIEWIGDIPSDWDILYLFQVTDEQKIPNREMQNSNLLSLSYGKIVNKNINTTDGLLPLSFNTYQIVNDGNIILRLTDLQNDHKSLRVGLATQTGIITSAYTCLQARDSIEPGYLYLLLHSFDICKLFYGLGGGVRQSIGYADIKKVLILLPTIQEQKKIIEYCTERIVVIERYINDCDKSIKLLEEYRARLISDVVTGKLDVRDVEIPDYEAVEEAVNPADIETDEMEGEQDAD